MINEELNDLYSSSIIVGMNKLRKIRWAGFIASMGERRDLYRFLVGKLRERDHLEDPGIDGRIILKKDIQEVGCGDMTGSSWLRMVTDGGNCESGNERSGSIKYGEFLV